MRGKKLIKKKKKEEEYVKQIGSFLVIVKPTSHSREKVGIQYFLDPQGLFGDSRVDAKKNIVACCHGNQISKMAATKVNEILYICTAP